MPRLLSVALASCLAGLAAGQGTTDRAPSVPGSRPAPPAVGACARTEAAFDATAATADVAILGVAHARGAGKWFFAGRNGAPQGGGLSTQVLHVFDEDRDGRPRATTWRALPQRGVTQSWGHRDLAYDASTHLVFAGDEARTIHAIDPVAERYVSQAWTLSGLPSPTIRALAVARVAGTFGANTLRVACTDWTTPITLWDLELVAPWRASARGTTLPNPGNTYGLAFADGGHALVAFCQDQNPCAATPGLHRVHVLDPATGAVRFVRGGDEAVLGEAGWPYGGIAGGCELTVVSNQTVLAVVQQALDDALAFLPLGGHAFLDDATGCAVGPRLLPLGDATVPGPGFGLEVRGLPPQTATVVFVDAARTPSPFPLPSGCLLDVSLAAPLLLLLAPDGLGAARLALPIPADPVLEGRDVHADSVEVSLATLQPTTSSQVLAVHFDRSHL